MNNKIYQDRAKQFMPFDTLKGLQEELREKENEIEYEKESENRSYSFDE